MVKTFSYNIVTADISQVKQELSKDISTCM